MSKLGIHFPNARFRNLDALWSIPWEHFVVLHHNRAWVPEIRLRFPRATILVRAYLKNWTMTDPVDWARQISQWADELRPFNIQLTFANEQNLAAEGHPLGARPGADYPPESLYQDILAWDMTVIQELRARVPWATLHFPALSQGHSDDQEDARYVGLEILRPAVQMCNVLDAHAYWDSRLPGQYDDLHTGQRYRLLHSLFPNMPIFVSECGVLSPGTQGASDQIGRWLETLPEYVSGACWFIWDSDANNQGWILQDYPPLVQGLRAMQSETVPPPESQPVLDPIRIASGLVKDFAGFAAKPHAEPGREGQVVGYGHTIRQGERFDHRLTEDDAEELLRQDLELCLRMLEQNVLVPLTMNQQAALLSFLHDVGMPALQDSAVLDRINSADSIGAAREWSRWQSSGMEDGAGIATRRQIESDLFLKDLIHSYSYSSPPLPQTTSAPVAPALAFTTPAASWISVKQGERNQVIGVWYSDDRFPAIANGGPVSSGSEKQGQVWVRVEDASGVGIPAELVARRTDTATGECEFQFTDSSGAVSFALSTANSFDPRQGPGRESIQVGDCTIKGLGIPSNGLSHVGRSIHWVRIRKNC